jgi:MFS family permease
VTEVARGPAPPIARKSKLWTVPFTLVTAATLMCYVHQYMLTPILPLYVGSLGGDAVLAGLVLASFSITSFSLRPFVGFAVDRWSAAGVVLVGSLILAACGLLYLIPPLWLLFVVNAIRGVGWAGLNTGGNALLAYVAPRERRGEASAYFSMAQNSVTAFAPAIALHFVTPQGADYNAVFVLSAVAALIGAGVTALLIPSAARAQAAARAGSPPASLSMSRLVDPGVAVATGLLVCLTLTTPATTAFVPLYALGVGIDNPGAFYIATGLTAIWSRIAFGRFLDRGSRSLWIAVGFGLMIVGFAMMLLARDTVLFALAGVLIGMGYAAGNSALIALALDRANPARPGAAMATFSVAYQIGMAAGSPLFGLLIEHVGFWAMYAGAIAICIVGLAVTAASRAEVQRGSAATR